jgi:hypothetical protein
MKVFESFFKMGVGRQIRVDTILVWHAIVGSISNFHYNKIEKILNSTATGFQFFCGVYK